MRCGKRSQYIVHKQNLFKTRSSGFQRAFSTYKIIHFMNYLSQCIPRGTASPLVCLPARKIQILPIHHYFLRWVLHNNPAVMTWPEILNHVHAGVLIAKLPFYLESDEKRQINLISKAPSENLDEQNHILILMA